LVIPAKTGIQKLFQPIAFLYLDGIGVTGVVSVTGRRQLMHHCRDGMASFPR
jgi:hypothetical protein